ncbi:hypothetical protein DAPPUDRAFT_104926 [Daphnia pulex]|uniref:Uncharacterized protein n=1 Tax=Daphnia pulex TaxID=6669 RepID=E9GNT7_DAPPU|nr:hypothetical protein DAPPUDRAFT_104926 [Daphnia pulex]|eukprot:EFX78895.1 hypothetical protein DAPPUDRAFT_104926 [Daphnia pulex]
MTEQFSERNKQARAPKSGLLDITIHLAKMNHWLYKIPREVTKILHPTTSTNFEVERELQGMTSQSPDNQLGYTELHSLEVENCGYERDSLEQVILPGTSGIVNSHPQLKKITAMKMKHKTILLSGLTLLGMRIPVQN